MYRSCSRINGLSPLKPRSGLHRQLARPRDHVVTNRSFITLPNQGPATISSSQILPYPRSELFAFISDVDAYSSYLPYCVGSRVLQRSPPRKSSIVVNHFPEHGRVDSPEQDAGRQYPSEAELRVGFGGLEEGFTSYVFCVPDEIVEAVAGGTPSTCGEPVRTVGTKQSNGPSLLPFQLPFSSGKSGPSTHDGDAFFSHLLTRWTLRSLKPPPGQEFATEVSLYIEFALQNVMLDAAARIAAPQAAGIISDAYKKRAEELLGKRR